MASRGPCRRVWLCATDRSGDLCYQHYHTCWRASGHLGGCRSGSGPDHTSHRRIGDVFTDVSINANITAAYEAMRLLGWR